MSRRAALELLEDLFDRGLTARANRAEGTVRVGPSSKLTPFLRSRIRDLKPALLDVLAPENPSRPCPCGGDSFVRTALGPWRCARCTDLPPEEIASAFVGPDRWTPAADDGKERRSRTSDGPLFDLEERIERFVHFYDDDDGPTREEILCGVEGREEEIETALDELARGGIPIRRDDSANPPEYSVRERAKRCPECEAKIGPTAETCVSCRREREREEEAG